VTVSGFARRRRVLTRAGGRVGDDVYVTGEVGGAAAGLQYWKQTRETTDPKQISGMDACIARHRRPEPRVRIGMLLGRNGAATACMDLSDGLADAVRQIAEASGTGARIEADALPIDEAARAWFLRSGHDPITGAIAGGDDYELLFTASRRARGRLGTVMRQARGVRITRIGVLTGDRDLTVSRDGREEALPAGFVHF